jgi:phosphatidylglycerophosphate synthase
MEPAERLDEPPRTSRSLATLPNLLTLTRLGLGIAFPLLPETWRLGAFLLATATEALDGALARLLQATSLFGQVLDPIADKVFVLSVLVTLAIDGSRLRGSVG